MKNVKKSAVIISALLLVCAILFTGCPNASGGAKPPADSAGSSGGSSGGTGSGGGSGGSGSGGSGGGSSGGGGTVRLTIRGDERIDIAASGFIDVGNGKTWAQIRGEVEPKVSLQSKWPTEEYGVYEWRVTDENGAPLADGYIFTENTTVYAVTNYTKFKIENGIVKGYTGAQPKGKIIIPDGITEIAKDAFYKCEELTQVRFPKSLKKIESNDDPNNRGALRNCTKLSTADFSACTELTEIGNRSFLGCTNLTEVKLPENLRTIGTAAFSGCTALTGINFPANAKLHTIGRSAFTDCGLMGVLKLPAELQTIGEWAFSRCKGLTEVEFPAELQTIGEWAFSNCTGLTGTLNLPSRLHTIGKWAFSDCKGLTEVKFPAELHTIGEFAFSECEGLTEVKFPANLQKIGKEAFVLCTEVTLFDFSSCTTKLTEIGSNAFSICYKAGFRVKKGSGVKEKLIASGVVADKIEEID